MASGVATTASGDESGHEWGKALPVGPNRCASLETGRPDGRMSESYHYRFFLKGIKEVRKRRLAGLDLFFIFFAFFICFSFFCLLIICQVGSPV